MRSGSSAARRLWLIFGLLLIGLESFAVVAATNVQLGCGSQAIDTPQRISRLYCAHSVREHGGVFLVLTNPPSRSGDDITDYEGHSVVAQYMQLLPGRFSGLCFQRKGIDTVPTCTQASGQSQPVEPLRLVGDDRHPYSVAVLVSAVFWLAVLVLYDGLRRARREQSAGDEVGRST